MVHPGTGGCKEERKVLRRNLHTKEETEKRLETFCKLI
jgi:hypothetical protein